MANWNGGGVVTRREVLTWIAILVALVGVAVPQVVQMLSREASHSEQMGVLLATTQSNTEAIKDLTTTIRSLTDVVAINVRSVDQLRVEVDQIKSLAIKNEARIFSKHVYDKGKADEE